MPDQIIVVNASAVENGGWVTTPDMVWSRKRSRGGVHPSWSTGEVAKTFYGLAKETLINYLVEFGTVHPGTGEDLDIPRTPTGHRPYIWTLYHIERYAEILMARGKFNGQRWHYVQDIVHAVARQHRFL